jgi:hypothetical protein
MFCEGPGSQVDQPVGSQLVCWKFTASVPRSLYGGGAHGLSTPYSTMSFTLHAVIHADEWPPVWGTICSRCGGTSRASVRGPKRDITGSTRSPPCYYYYSTELLNTTTTTPACACTRPMQSHSGRRSPCREGQGRHG